jgi:hypothetical protein
VHNALELATTKNPSRREQKSCARYDESNPEECDPSAFALKTRKKRQPSPMCDNLPAPEPT